jgi:tetratricopeptide (TPR) repeat protein
MKKIVLITVFILLLTTLVFSDAMKVAFLGYKKVDRNCDYVLNRIMKSDLKKIFQDEKDLQLIDLKLTKKVLKSNKIKDIFDVSKEDLVKIGKSLNADILIRGTIEQLDMTNFKIYNTLFNVKSQNLAQIDFEIPKNTKKRIKAFKENLIPQLKKFATSEIDQLLSIANRQYYDHDYKSALENYQKVLTLDSSKLDPYIFIGYIYFQQENPDVDKAIEYYQKGLQIDPKNKKLLHLLSLAYLKKDESDKAIEVLKKITEMEEDAKTWFEIGKIYESNDDLDNAKIAFDKALEIDENYLECAKEAANMMYDNEEYDQAIPYLEKATKINPDDDILQDKLAKCYHVAGKLDAAIEQYKGVIKDKPNNIRAYLNLAAAYRTLNQLDNAIATLKNAKKIDDKNPQVYIRLADAYLAKQNFKLAEQNANKAIELNPNLATPYKILSQEYQITGYKKYEKFIDYDEKARKAFGKESDRLAKLRNQNKREAHADFVKAMDYLNEYAKRAKSVSAKNDIKKRRETLKQLLDATKKEFFD